jgi:hypothetical protein
MFTGKLATRWQIRHETNSALFLGNGIIYMKKNTASFPCLEGFETYRQLVFLSWVWFGDSTACFEANIRERITYISEIELWIT